MGSWAKNSNFLGFHCRVSEKENFGNKPVPFGENKLSQGGWLDY